ncbi:hypothetical protein J1605_003665 [Eschrichtius robustus]|uniref:AMP-dependent synthetase/ligase domain-containing protein n=1 Tax=Eschrichtius robustus TaxID=9764 RepID=A0AB34HRB1_ESCRO|nr:hypothetical protein J1605_003665 [Eschrichtius robustus]
MLMMTQDYAPEPGVKDRRAVRGPPPRRLPQRCVGQGAVTSQPPGESGLCTEASNPRGARFLSVALGETAVLRKPRGSAVFLGSRRVALVFPNSDPVMFTVAFYGCLLAELVPVPIEVPLTRKDAGSQQVGFLLGSCGVALALTTDACQKGLPKAQTGEVAAFKGWPPLTWLVIDGKHLTKPPKDWHPSAQDAGAGTAYIEYKTSKEGSTVGVAVSHASLLAQCQALTQACGYSEAETLTNVLDFKRDAGLWHGVLTSVMNRMHVVSVPYALMKANPLSWIQKVCAYKARAALVKSRDMHWSLLAQRGQRGVSLSSLRLLIVADGANPWSISSCDAFLNVFQARGLRPEVICPCASSPEALTVAIRSTQAGFPERSSDQEGLVFRSKHCSQDSPLFQERVAGGQCPSAVDGGLCLRDPRPPSDAPWPHRPQAASSLGSSVSLPRPPQVCPSAHLPARVVHAALSAILGVLVPAAAKLIRPKLGFANSSSHFTPSPASRGQELGRAARGSSASRSRVSGWGVAGPSFFLPAAPGSLPWFWCPQACSQEAVALLTCCSGLRGTSQDGLVETSSRPTGPPCGGVRDGGRRAHLWGHALPPEALQPAQMGTWLLIVLPAGGRGPTPTGSVPASVNPLCFQAA